MKIKSHKRSTPKTYQGGQAMMVAVMFVLGISIVFMAAVATPVANQIRGASGYIQSKQGYILADSSVEDIIYRLNNGKVVGSSVESVLNGGGATTTITNVSASLKRILTTATVGDYVRKMQADVTMGSGVAFNYGLQAGNGGVTLGGGSTIIGNIYSNGDIDAISATITGSATAADSAALNADQVNDTPTTPTNAITFRNVAASQDFAQSFQVSTSSPLNKVQFYIKKVGTPSDATVRLVADNAGSPSTTVISIGTISLLSSQVTTSYGWVEVVFPTNPSLVPGTTYWIVLDSSTQSSSNYYVIGGNTSYAAGTAKTGSYSGAWTASGYDGYFRLYLGGIPSMIGGAGYVGGVTIGSGGVGDAWASTVRGASVAGNLYCTTGTNNNKACNTTHGTPSPQGMPFSDANIQDWKDEAAAGGTIAGNYTVGWAGGTLGPKKITGNLTVNGGGTLTLTGTIWVQGTVTITSGGRLVLPAAFAGNSGVMISDSTITVSGGGSAGSGTAGSYLFFVSTSRCPNDINCSGNSAINITGGAGAIAANAQSGNIALSGGASINAAVGNTITVSGGSTVTYDTGLASPSFSSGPSGSYIITDWSELTN